MKRPSGKSISGSSFNGRLSVSSNLNTGDHWSCEATETSRLCAVEVEVDGVTGSRLGLELELDSGGDQVSVFGVGTGLVGEGVVLSGDWIFLFLDLAFAFFIT